MTEDLFSVSQTLGTSVPIIMVNIVLAFLLSFVIAELYKRTHKGMSYSQSFCFTLVLIGLLISVIMMVIGNSLARAFGAFGAFSLIRFRTAIKDPKDVAFILLVVAIGLATGTGNYFIAVFTTIFAIIIIIILTKINFGSIRKYDYILNFSAETSRFSNDRMREVFNEYLKSSNLLNVIAREKGAVMDYSFNIRFKNRDEVEKFIAKLNKIEGVRDVDVMNSKEDIEY